MAAERWHLVGDEKSENEGKEEEIDNKGIKFVFIIWRNTPLIILNRLNYSCIYVF